MIGLGDGPGGYLYCRRFWRSNTQQASAKAETMTRDVGTDDMWSSATNILRVDETNYEDEQQFICKASIFHARLCL